MNYSIILLGATISVSLFIRICGVCSALEINSLSARGSDNYESWSPPNYKEDELFVGNFRHNDDPRSFGAPQDIEPVVTSESHCVDDFQHDVCGEEPLCPQYLSQRQRPNTSLDITEMPEGCTLKYDKFNETVLPTLFCEFISTIPSFKFSLDEFEIARSNFSELPANAFVDVSINNIILQHNQFSKISPYAFADIENVKNLRILYNDQLSYLPYDLYKGLNNLNFLYLGFNKIDFTVYDKCKQRSPEEIPLVLKSLLYLSFEGNPLKKIPSQMWAGLRESPLTALILSSCSLEEIAPESFSYIKNLKTLYLDNNPRLNFTTAFLGLQNSSLSNLKLSDNGFKIVPTKELSIVAQTLTTLDLSQNKFDRIYSSDFPSMPKLTTLVLKSCGILDIGDGTFENFPSITDLDLSENSLYSIPPSMLSLSRLKYLNLDYNAPKTDVGNFDPTFTIKANELSSSFPLLSTLFINNTPVKSITKGMFNGLPRLSMLYLKNAAISSIESGAFQDLPTIRTLLLSNNQLTEITTTMLDGLQNLTILYLQNNAISFVYPETFAFEETTEDSAETSQFGLQCHEGLEISSDLTKLSPFSLLNSLEYLEIGGNRMQCPYPQLFEGLHKLTTLDLSTNQIRSWESPIFPKNFSITRGKAKDDFTPSIFRLNLSGNRIRSVSNAILEDLISYAPNEIDLTDNNMYCDLGSCKLRDLINNSSNFEFPIPTIVNWTNLEEYTCVHWGTGKSHLIKTISDETCESSERATNIPGGEPIGKTHSPVKKTVLLVTGIVCGTCFIAGLLVTGYKKRLHLHYILFKVKLNVKEMSPRKAKLSEVREHEDHFEYDLFVSYHNQDRSFIIDQFLPEVEDPEITKNESSDYEVYKIPGTPCFRVCLHERDFEAGIPITENIVECVDKSRKIVIILTQKYLESQWCLFELNLAYHRLLEARRTSFVLVLMEHIPNSMRTKVLSYLMRSRTYLEWPGESATASEKKRFWNQLRASLISV